MSIEEKAISCAMEYEIHRGRTPINVSKDRKARGYDVLSDKCLDSERKIEVKGFGGRNSFFQLNSWNYEAFVKEENFFVYVVFDINTKAKLIEYDKAKLFDMLKKAKVYFNIEVPLRKKDFEKGVNF